MDDKLNCITRLRIRRGEEDTKTAFGHGTAQLLQGIRELKSLNRAAKRMGMAYSKAWKSIRSTEDHLGFQLIERKAQHGSELTEQGERFLDYFLRAEAAAAEAASKVFEDW
ncbi:MAG: LysR family transcriptional regulator [Oscillospiraceae bacterium]|nr:LysR family transcriptional regulator [Oscillospiraceae bacterium]